MSLLDEIVERKKKEVASRKIGSPDSVLGQRLKRRHPTLDFVKALGEAAPWGIIAEVKHHSPSHPKPFREDFDAVQIAKSYSDSGAACISCLTDVGFGGTIEDLARIRKAVDIPLLRKDFILDAFQVAEARIAGADCVLLIAECLDDVNLGELISYTRELEMQVLLEVFKRENIDRAIRHEPEMIGVNCRNLEDFEVDINRIVELAKEIPSSMCFVGESGVKSRDDVKQVLDAGANALLVGTVLMEAEDPGLKLRELLRQSRD